MTDSKGSAKTCYANAYDVTPKDLPLSCPTAEMSLWNAHPRVYLPIEKTGQAKCPYCGTEYTLKKTEE